jgi:hypothetical protein
MMEQLLTIIAVAGLFLVRIGVPVLALLTIGLLIERWQSHREQALRQELRQHHS